MSELTACLYGFTDKLDFIPSYNSQQCFLEKPDFVPTFNSQQCFRSLKTEEQSLIITFSYSSICFCLPANTVAVSFYMITERFEAFKCHPLLRKLSNSVCRSHNLPSHSSPFPVNPSLQAQVWDHWYCYKLHFDCNYVTVQQTRLCLKKWNKQQQSINS